MTFPLSGIPASKHGSQMSFSDSSALEDLLNVMARLRDPESGCPWDCEQTLETLLPYTIEEAYEVADAIEQRDTEQLVAELGDLLFHIVFYAQILSERGDADFQEIAGRIAQKMRRRHPHVFGDARQADAAGVANAWEAGKSDERRERAQREGRRASALDDVALALPALIRAQKIQRRAAGAGFDWADVKPVIAKIREELEELEAEIDADDASASDIGLEAGDLLFACVNLARHAGVDAEVALRNATGKFENRFRAIENALADRGKTTAESDLEEMDSLWCEIKAAER